VVLEERIAALEGGTAALAVAWRATRQDDIIAQAQALGVLATSYIFCGHMGWQDLASMAPKAERSGLAAIQADHEDAWAHNALGYVYVLQRRFDDSLAEGEGALTLNPNFAQGQGFHGLSLAYSGRWQDAVKAAERAIRLSPSDPFSGIYSGIAAYAHFLGANYVEAMRLAREALRQRSDFVGAHRVLTAAAGMAGRDDIAAPALRELRRAQPNISLAWLREHMPIRLDSDREHYLEGFRRAGLD